MRTAADLNADADDDAARYTTVALFVDAAGTDVASGGAATAITWYAAGDPRSDVAGVDGIAWSHDVSFTLAERAYHFGLFTGGVLMRTDPLPHPIGPGTVPFACGVGPAA